MHSWQKCRSPAFFVQLKTVTRDQVIPFSLQIWKKVTRALSPLNLTAAEHFVQVSGAQTSKDHDGCCHITPISVALRWLLVSFFFFRIDFKICTACFESLGTVSCCTCDPLTPWEPGRCRRPSDKNLLIVSTSRLADKRRPLVSILV